MSHNSGFVDTKASRVPSCGSLVKATELRDRPGGFSLGAFGVTVFGGAGFPEAAGSPARSGSVGAFFAADSPVTCRIPSLSVVGFGQLLFARLVVWAVAGAAVAGAARGP